MIVYDNSQQLLIIFKMTGSVLPGCLPVGLFSFTIGLTLALLRHFDKIDKVFGTDRLIVNSFSIQTIALVIGYLLVVRTNMALGRWMDGISEIQLMLSKWGDAFDALNGFFAGRHVTATKEQRQRILDFRIRAGHWFSLMSCLAFATLRNNGKLETLHDVPIKEMLAEDPRLSKTKSFTLSKTRSDGSLSAASENGNGMIQVEEDLIEGLDLLVLSAPTAEEVALLEMSHDKVSTVCLWIIQSIVLEIRAGTLDTPPPIVSRVFQEISIGMLGYNQANKVATTPFPFPFAQLVSLLLVMLYVAMPFYIDMFTKQIVVTPIISFLLPTVYCGLNLIAIELEEPFGTDWNDVDIEVRHEEFLWMLVDVLRQPDCSPISKHGRIEDKILRGCCQGVGREVLAREVVAYMPNEHIEGGHSDSASNQDMSEGDGVDNHESTKVEADASNHVDAKT